MSSVSNRRSCLGNAGVTSLELALVLVVFMWLLMGVFDLGRYFFTVQSMVTLMAEAGRYVTIAGEGSGTALQGVAAQGAGPECYAINTFSSISAVVPPPLLDPTQGQICINVLTPFGLGVNQIQVTVNYPFTAFTPGLSGLNGTLTENPLTETATYSY
jgi:hypothetical protein